MAACLDRIRMSACSLADEFMILAGCAGAFDGGVAMGQSCVDDRECTSGACLHGDCGLLCCPGICGLSLRGTVPLGGPCAGDFECVTGTFCAPDGTCAAPVSQGATCSSRTLCQSPLVCVRGTCHLPPGRGDPCDPASVPACDRVDDYCDPGTQVCRALPSEGDACPEPDPATTPVQTCATDAWCDGGTCHLRPGAGQPCTRASQCLPGLFCDPAADLCTALFSTTGCPL